MFGVPRLEPGAALAEGKRAQVFVVVEKKIVEANMRRICRHHFRRHRLAVEALLQVVERRDLAIAHDQQLAVDNAIARR